MTHIMAFFKLPSCLRITYKSIPAKIVNTVLPHLAHLEIATQCSVASDMAALMHIWAGYDLCTTCGEADCHCLQDSRLNYIEQHADRFGVDTDKLENARVNASKVSPMNDTLDLCARYANGKTLDEMVSHCCCFQLGLVASAQLRRMYHVLCLTYDTHLLLVPCRHAHDSKLCLFACLPACTHAQYGSASIITSGCSVDICVFKTQVPKLCALVKRGIGLNTRTGCARFIISLTTRQGADIKPHTAAFIKVKNLPQRGFCLASAAAVQPSSQTYASNAQQLKCLGRDPLRKIW